MMENKEELRIVATVTVKPAYKEELFKVFEAVVNATRKETGNISYGLFEHVGDPNKFTFLEVWKSQAAIDSHNASEHFQAFAKAIEGKVEGLDVNIVKEKF